MANSKTIVSILSALATLLSSPLLISWWTTPTLKTAMECTIVTPYNLSSQPLVLREPFIASINKCLRDPSFGVYVVWAPPQSGKTVYLEHSVGGWLNESGLHRVKWYANYNHFNKPSDLLQERLHVESPRELEVKLKELGNELLIVLDQFDEAFALPESIMEPFIVELAQASQHGKNFRVVLGVQNAELADKIIGWNGNGKIMLCADRPGGDATAIEQFKWGQDEALKLLGDVGGDWSAADKELFVDKATRSSNLHTMIHMKADPTLLNDTQYEETVVKPREEAWKTGIQWLHSHSTRVQKHQEHVRTHARNALTKEL